MTYSKADQIGPSRKPRRLAVNSTLAAPEHAMAKMSPKRKAFYRDVYAPMRDAAVGDGLQPCQIGSPVCTGYVEHLHEIYPRGRAGGLPASLRDGPAPVGACDPCNGYVSANPVWAREHGWLVRVSDVRDAEHPVDGGTRWARAR